MGGWIPINALKWIIEKRKEIKTTDMLITHIFMYLQVLSCWLETSDLYQLWIWMEVVTALEHHTMTQRLMLLGLILTTGEMNQLLE